MFRFCLITIICRMRVVHLIFSCSCGDGNEEIILNIKSVVLATVEAVVVVVILLVAVVGPVVAVVLAEVTVLVVATAIVSVVDILAMIVFYQR